MWRIKIAEKGKNPNIFSTNNFIGRQTWEYDPNGGTPEERAEVEEARLNYWNNRFHTKPSSDLLWQFQFLREKNFKQSIPAVRIKEDEEITKEAATSALRRGVHLISALQAEDGHWPFENSGPMFFLPPMIFSLYITGSLNEIVSKEYYQEILRYIYCHQNEDGGWGLHMEGHSMMFTTVLNYVCMRILGEGPNGGLENACERARKWILDHGGATAISSWGKTWLSILGIHEWDGSNPIPPEFWLFPTTFPFHPAKMFCYCRIVYMPMSYLYAKRFVGPITPLILQLREEIYNQPYHTINWGSIRHLCAKEDNYYPHGRIQKLMWDSLYMFGEPILTHWPFNKLREKAIKKTMEHIHYEDENSRYITIACVQKALFMLACWVEDPNGDAFKKHLARMAEYFWISEDGMKIHTFGSQSWDASYILQALIASNLSDEIGSTLAKGHYFLKNSQVTENPSGDFRKMFRYISKGSWTFSDKDHGWQVSDCTAEAFKCCMLFSMMPSKIVGEKLEDEKFYDAVNILLSLQSKNGGETPWEPAGASPLLEWLNPVEFVEGIVIENEYVENTSAAIQALVLFSKLYPEHRKKEIEKFIAKAVKYITDMQREDGSWYGCWGICFIYATWFGLDGLAAAGNTYENCEAVRRGVEFLLKSQNADGGWGRELPFLR